MSLNFEPKERCAFDRGSRVLITPPRILPASPPEDSSHTEYQYMFHRDDERIGGLGLFGTDVVAEIEGRRERVTTLDLGRDWVLQSVLGFKQTLADTGDEFLFICGLARGLAIADMGDRDSEYDLRCVAVTKSDVLGRMGIAIPDGVVQGPEGEVVLAEVRLLASVD